VSAALTELYASREDDAAALQEATDAQLTQLRERITSELDYNRLQHLREVESFIDTMSRGWQALFTRFESTDRRVAKIEGYLDELLGEELAAKHEGSTDEG
jgi:hypothetical protein